MGLKINNLLTLVSLQYHFLY